MGINRAIVYAAFGNKEDLFKKAIDRYAQGPGCHVKVALDKPGLRAPDRAALQGDAGDLVTNRRPAAVHGPRGLGVRRIGRPRSGRELVKRRAASEAASQALSRALAEGDLPPSSDRPPLLATSSPSPTEWPCRRRGARPRPTNAQFAKMAIRACPA